MTRQPSAKNRTSAIIKASWISISGNALLSIMKITLGFVAGSMAVVGDGIDSATDIVASVITLLAAQLMSRPPNIKFPYGYEKADALASKVLSFVIFFAGAQLAISTITSLIEGTEKTMPTFLAIYVTLFSIVGKFLLAFYQFRVGKKTQSNMLIANARNMQNDVLISAAVLIGLFFTFIMEMPVIDSITALAVSVWIMYAAVRIFLQTSTELMDGLKDDTIYKKVFKAISSVKGVYNPHRARIRKIGNQYAIVIDIEVEPSKTVKQAHDYSQQVEKKIKEVIPNVYEVLIHVEPYGNIESDEGFGISDKDLKK